MPIYEYHCQDCQAEFELIRSIRDADAPLPCTKCQGENITRKLSLFNATSNGRSLSGTTGGCGTCAGGTCSSCGSR